jgi:hypothetical protein
MLYLKMNLEFSEGTLPPSLVFFFLSEGTFNIADVAEFAGLDRDGHLHQEGEDEKADCPNPKGHHEFQEIRNINVNFAERIRDKPWYDETRSFFNPDPYDDKKTAHVQGG